MEIEVAVAKIQRHAASESGDTFEMVERPRGGLSLVLADGQRAGRSAKFISNLVARRTIALLGEGARDIAATRAAHDYLCAYRGGRVSATLNIVSVGVSSGVVRITRSNPMPVLVARPGGIDALDDDAAPVGHGGRAEPGLSTIELRRGCFVVVASDGLFGAGRPTTGTTFDPAEAMSRFLDGGGRGAAQLADALLERAVALDDGRPHDDISVLVLTARERAGDGARRLLVRVPLSPAATSD